MSVTGDSVGVREWEGMKGDSVKHGIRYCEKNEIVQSGRNVALCGQTLDSVLGVSLYLLALAWVIKERMTRWSWSGNNASSNVVCVCVCACACVCVCVCTQHTYTVLNV